MNIKILAQNILNNPSNFTVEEIEKYFENYAESYNKLKQTLLEIRKNPMSFTSQPEISDDEIEKSSKQFDSFLSRLFFQLGAKWYREQLKQK